MRSPGTAIVLVLAAVSIGTDDVSHHVRADAGADASQSRGGDAATDQLLHVPPVVPAAAASAPPPATAALSSSVLPKHIDLTCADRINTCPFYGCPLLPRDVHHDDRARAALEVLRGISSDDNDDNDNDDTSTGSSGRSDSSTKTSPPRDVERALDELQSSGTSRAGTLTLIGYKGGSVESQINQDRAFVVSPFHIPSSSFAAAAADDNIDNDTDPDPAAVGKATSTSATTCIDRSALQSNEGASSGTAQRGGMQQMLGVFDGHDVLGEQVSEYAVQQVPRLVATKLAALAQSERGDGADGAAGGGGWTNEVRVERTKQVLRDTFVEVDGNGLRELGIPGGGCTASVILHLDDMLYVANAGDSQSFIATYIKSTGKVEVVYVTREDKPTLPDERERVEASGGKVYLPKDPRESSRVYYIDSAGKFVGGLAMSRSLGDWDLGGKGVIPDPIVDAVSISDIIARTLTAERDTCKEDGDTEENEEEGTCSAVSADDVNVFAISATDGIMDYLEPIDIAKEVAGSLFRDEQSESNGGGSYHLFAAQTSLMLASAQGWHSEMKGEYRDDMAIAAAVVR